MLLKCERICNVCIFPYRTYGIYFSENYWNIIMKKKKTFPIYHSFKEVFYRNVNPYRSSESLHDVPHVIYTLFLSPNTIQWFFFFLFCAANNKKIVFGRHWFGGCSYGKLDSYTPSWTYISRFSVERRQIRPNTISNRILDVEKRTD